MHREELFVKLHRIFHLLILNNLFELFLEVGEHATSFFHIYFIIFLIIGGFVIWCIPYRFPIAIIFVPLSIYSGRLIISEESLTALHGISEIVSNGQ
jgi:hypothetical protein